MPSLPPQKTLAKACQVAGVGVHSGQEMTLTVRPAPADTGLVFRRTDLPDTPEIQGRWNFVSDTRLCTQLTNEAGISIGTVEHLLAALQAYEIDNAYLDVTGPEIPILDGSAALFIQAIEGAGVVETATPCRILRLLKTIEIREENRFVALDPLPTPAINPAIKESTQKEGTQKATPPQSFPRGLEHKKTFTFSIDFFGGREGMPPQSYSFTWDPAAFRGEIGGARTFGFYEDAQKLLAMGLARGASLDNAVIIQEGQVMNEGGLRFHDEFVRHKILDAVGDLALAGVRLEGAYTSHNGGHELNNRLLRQLFKTPEAWEEVEHC